MAAAPVLAYAAMSEIREVRYAHSGDLNIAYQVVGDAEIDLVIIPGMISHLDLEWEYPPHVRSLRRFAHFSRLILFDKRGIGLSDPVQTVPTLEERMDDVRAVLDAVASPRAALFGISEGVPMALLFAATYPDRVSHLILYGGMARTVADDDYPYAPRAEDQMLASMELVLPYWGQGATLETFAPSVAEDPQARAFFSKFERQAVSPAALTALFQMFLDTDVRAVLETIHVPTLVMHRRGDRVVNVRAGRYLAERIPGARMLELPGDDHNFMVGDPGTIIDEVEAFLTGGVSAPNLDRVLATVMFTDIVGSTERAADLGDARWHRLLDEHHTAVRGVLERYRGREVKTLGDGFLATFDGPARAVRCGQALTREGKALGTEIRVGLHTGEVEVMDDDVGGIAVHIASRITELAAPGEVLVSRTVKDLVAGSGLQFQDRGTHVLRGVPEEWQLLALSGETPGAPMGG